MRYVQEKCRDSFDREMFIGQRFKLVIVSNPTHCCCGPNKAGFLACDGWCIVLQVLAAKSLVVS